MTWPGLARLSEHLFAESAGATPDVPSRATARTPLSRAARRVGFGDAVGLQRYRASALGGEDLVVGLGRLGLISASGSSAPAGADPGDRPLALCEVGLVGFNSSANSSLADRIVL